MISSPVLESVISLFLIILVGVYASRKKIITEDLNQGLVNLLIQIVLPVMILSSFIYSYDQSIKSEVVKTFYYSLIAYLLMFSASYLLLLPFKSEKKIILHFANVFPNTGYVGFPVLYSIYGTEGIVYGSVFNLFFVIFVWTYGIFIYRGSLDKTNLKQELKQTFLNPSVLAVGIGLIIMTLNLQLPNSLITSIKNIGNITGPLSMLIIGVILSKAKIGNYTKDWTLYYGAICKLLLIPIIVYLISLLTGQSSKAINSVIIMTAMPASAMTSILAQNYNRETDYAAVIVSLTTLFSILSIPVLLKIIL
ncbi:MAG: AEC family transporter [Firmicutes bacterium]|nr:AEC family transporter [Bacillota bacterium]